MSPKERAWEQRLTMQWQLDRLVGLSMLIAATAIFVYYTVWTLFMVRTQCLVDDMRLPACSFFF